MADRLELHAELIDVLGSPNVYFQPPPTVLMNYNAIRYKLSGKDIIRANDKLYRIVNQYEGVVITKDPESDIPDKLLMRFPMCSVGRPYQADKLNHFPFTIYY